MDQNELLKAKNTKIILDQISPSFCTVKWKHATINLGSGAVKSCCHLPFRKIHIDNIDKGLQLHDTPDDQNERAMMLQGQKPKDCSYCWWVEENGHISDRIAWSSKSWMSPYTETIAKNKYLKAESPSWLELNFSNICNLKCSYCSPIFSSKWLQEIKEHGPYPTTPGHNDINYLPGIEFNEKYDNTKLMKTFWPWFESVYPNLMLLKITGGEPLLSNNTFKILDWVQENPNQKLNLSVNSNLSIQRDLWASFVQKSKVIQEKKAIDKFYLHPSIDSYGARAEYIRHGLNFNLFQSNVEEYLQQTNGNIVFICTINNLSLGGLKDLWNYILELKAKYGPKGQWISLTSEVLMGPEWQNINILPEKFQDYLLDVISFAESNCGEGLEKFSVFEIQGLYRALELMKKPPSEISRARKNFFNFFLEHDRRRNTDLKGTFPELLDFWELCSKI